MGFRAKYFGVFSSGFKKILSSIYFFSYNSSCSSRGCSNCSKLCNTVCNLGYISQVNPKKIDFEESLSQNKKVVWDTWEKSFEQAPVQKSISFEQFEQVVQKF
jgi:hypothetical protein